MARKLLVRLAGRITSHSADGRHRGTAEELGQLSYAEAATIDVEVLGDYIRPLTGGKPGDGLAHSSDNDTSITAAWPASGQSRFSEGLFTSRCGPFRAMLEFLRILCWPDWFDKTPVQPAHRDDVLLPNAFEHGVVRQGLSGVVR